MFDRPADEVHDAPSAPLWRFMDFTKYVSMLFRVASNMFGAPDAAASSAG